MTKPHPNRSTITCIVADDHPPIIDCVARYLSAAGYAVVATARDGEQALAAIELHRPAVCVADLRMPRIGGLELARSAKSVSPETAVLLYSGFADRGLVAEALEAGARGFALKDSPLDDLTRAIDLIASGSVYIDPVLAVDLARYRPGRCQATERPRARGAPAPRRRRLVRGDRRQSSSSLRTPSGRTPTGR